MKNGFSCQSWKEKSNDVWSLVKYISLEKDKIQSNIWDMRFSICITAFNCLQIFININRISERFTYCKYCNDNIK